MRPTEFTDDLYALLQTYAPVGTVISTLAQGNPNRISSLSPTGIGVETGRTRVEGTGPQEVPAWMVEAGWERLHDRSRLTNAELLATGDLNVKRSSFVCALLARLPGVEVVSTRPIVLELTATD